MADNLKVFSMEGLEKMLIELQQEKPGLADRVAELATRRAGLQSEEKRLEENLARIKDLLQQADGQHHGAEHLLMVNKEKEVAVREEIEYRALGDRRVSDLTAAELDRYLNLRAERAGYADDPLD